MFFALALFFIYRKQIHKTAWFLYVALWSIPLSYIAGQMGWLVAELGRQPWTIQDVLPLEVATSHVEAGNIIATFVIFALMFTALLVAEVAIMVKAIKKGPKDIEKSAEFAN